MDESELYEALGVEPPGPGGDTPPEDDPGGTPQTHTEEQQAGTQIPEGGAPEALPVQQPPEVDAQQEELRRQAEAVDRAYADAYEGRVNPYTGQSIRSKADHDALKQQMEEMHLQGVQERLRTLGLEPGDIEALISGHPAIQQAEQLMAEVQARQEEQRRTQAKEWYEGELREIAAIDPEVTDLEALKAKDPEQFSAMLGLVSKGIGLAQAYKMLNFDALMQRQGAASAQQERNRAAGKAHLVHTKGLSAEAVEVPAEVRAMYLDLMPDMSEKDMRAAYAEYLKTK